MEPYHPTRDGYPSMFELEDTPMLQLEHTPGDAAQATKLHQRLSTPTHKLVLALTTIMLTTVGAVSAIRALTLAPAVSAPPAATISIDAIHRQVDVTSLPVHEVRDPY